jgi:hypothetical protein
LTTVARALDIALESLATPEGEARSVSTARDSSVDREFARLLAHPKEFEDICEVSRALAARYPGVDDTSETFVAESLIQLAVQMDMRGGSCLSNLLVTFPNNLEVDAAIANTHALCTNTWHLGANCDRITRTH